MVSLLLITSVVYDLSTKPRAEPGDGLPKGEATRGKELSVHQQSRYVLSDARLVNESHYTSKSDERYNEASRYNLFPSSIEKG